VIWFVAVSPGCKGLAELRYDPPWAGLGDPAWTILRSQLSGAAEISTRFSLGQGDSLLVAEPRSGIVGTASGNIQQNSIFKLHLNFNPSGSSAKVWHRRTHLYWPGEFFGVISRATRSVGGRKRGCVSKDRGTDAEMSRPQGTPYVGCIRRMTTCASKTAEAL
jgi:hypothetical protein